MEDRIREFRKQQLVTADRDNGDHPAAARFETTHWSAVASAAANSHEALEELCARYWSPLYWHVRRLGYAATDAQDLTQAFFARLIEKRLLYSADAQRGRFRTFLLTAIHRFVINEWKSKRAQKRGGDRTCISLDFERAEANVQLEPFHNLTPEIMFRRNWATAVLEFAFTRLTDEQKAANKEQLFAALTPCLARADDAPSYREIGDRFDMSTDAVKMAVGRLRRKLGVMIREEVRKTVRSEDELNDELRELFSAFGR